MSAFMGSHCPPAAPWRVSRRYDVVPGGGGQHILTSFAEPAEVAAALERGGTVLDVPGDRYLGYGAPGVAFQSGDLLGLRHFPVSSLGRGYTSVWHRSPGGRWTFYTDVADAGCARYFAPAVDEVVAAPIRLEWTSPRRAVVTIDGGRRLTWSLLARSTLLTRIYNARGAALAPRLIVYPQLLKALDIAARLTPGVGPLPLAGRTPNGSWFTAAPSHVWMVQASRACIGGQDTGPSKPLGQPVSLGEVIIPRRPILAAAHLVVCPGVGYVNRS
jgi:hypothetical protein